MPWTLFDDLWSWDPAWRRAFSPFGYRRPTRTYPAINIYGDDDKLLLVSELPGLKSDDLEITVQGRTLALKGVKNGVELGEGEEFITRERGRGEFARTLTLPYEVEPYQVEAHYDKGVLKITLPRVERDKPRKIAIKAA